jgi:hypothetical protein
VSFVLVAPEGRSCCSFATVPKQSIHKVVEALLLELLAGCSSHRVGESPLKAESQINETEWFLMKRPWQKEKRKILGLGTSCFKFTLWLLQLQILALEANKEH